MLYELWPSLFIYLFIITFCRQLGILPQLRPPTNSSYISSKIINASLTRNGLLAHATVPDYHRYHIAYTVSLEKNIYTAIKGANNK